MNNEEKILAILENMAARQDRTESLLEAMNSRFDKVDARLDRIERDQADMKAGMSDMKADIASIDKRLATVSDSVVRIENEHGNKLTALFDGYQQVYDKVANIEEHVSTQDDIILKRVFPTAAKR